MLIFISGSITNDPNFKEKFKQAQDKLVAQGHRVLNPCWIDAEIANLEHSEYLHIDFAMIDVADALYMLSDWHDSKGANYEYCHGVKNGKKIIYEGEMMEQQLQQKKTPCDNCKHFDDMFDCGQCKQYNEWEEKENDLVNHPSHYTQGKFEVIDIIEDATKDLKGIESVCVANVIKYILRYKYKNGVQDLKKAQWYLTRLIKKLEATDETRTNL